MTEYKTIQALGSEHLWMQDDGSNFGIRSSLMKALSPNFTVSISFPGLELHPQNECAHDEIGWWAGRVVLVGPRQIRLKQHLDGIGEYHGRGKQKMVF